MSVKSMKTGENALVGISECPKNWEVWKLSHAFKIIGSGTTPKSDYSEYYNGNLLWVNTSELRERIILNTGKRLTALALEDYPTLRIYNETSVVIAMYGATIGRLGILGKKATVNQACCVFDSSEVIHNKFLFYWLWIKRSVIISFSYGGGQPNLSQEILRQLRISVPSLREQQSIADFLDYKTGQIDKLIEQKEKLLKLLEEKRIALITKAVTKGLDPNVKMKDSGVEWLGEVPAHWEVKRLKYVADHNSQTLGEDTDPDLLISYVDISSVELFRGIVRKEVIMFYEAPSRARRLVKAGDTIISTVRTYLKAITYIENVLENLVVSTGFAVMSPKGMNSQYLSYYLQNEIFISMIVANSIGVSYPAINPSEIVKFPCAIPKEKEQKEIVQYLKDELEKIDYNIDLTNQAIELLKEYRISLITSAVTGKVDVKIFKRKYSHHILESNDKR